MTQLKLSDVKAEPHYVGTVVASWELKRIERLPRRTIDLASVPDLSPLYVREGSPYKLRPIQSAALLEAAAHNGLFAPIRAGAGKTLVGLLMPDALDSDCTVYLVEPALKRQLERELELFYSKHFLVPVDRLHIVSYSELSSAKKAEILVDLNPDAIIADEAHCLKNFSSARTKRFLRFMEARPECRFVAMSGTMTTRSIREYAHLADLALRKNSPVPSSYYELKAWAGALDAKPDELYHPGELKRFCAEGETPRQGFHRRLVETPGVVGTSEAEVGSSLIMRPVQIRIPRLIVDTMAKLRATWKIEDDENDYVEEISDATRMSAVQRQLGCGFYYVWRWPKGQVDREWMEARADWNREVRERLKRATEGMDSPYLLELAAERHRKWADGGRKGSRPEKSWDSLYWEAWRAVKDRPEPPVVPIWLDSFITQASVVWAKKQDKPAIIWYEHRAVGETLSKHFPHYGSGKDASTATEDVIVCSVRAQGTGKNLQHYSRNLCTSLSPSGKVLEQLMARTHRPGQLEDRVYFDYFQHTCSESLERIQKEDALYMQETTGQAQRVFYATHLPPINLRY